MRIKNLLVCILLFLLVIPFQSAYCADGKVAVGAVYTMTNDARANSVVVFDRYSDGTLSLVGSVPTGGRGSGGDLDPLGSQGSLVLSLDKKWLFAVNAGSNDISVFQVLPQGLNLVSNVPSYGSRPVSVAAYYSLVFVLNAGSQNITGFWMSATGRLYHLSYSTRNLPASSYGQIGFVRYGDNLVITDKGKSQILVYSLGWFGYPRTTPVFTPSTGLTPFGFTFDQRGHLLVAEAGSNAVSSYTKWPDDSFKTVSGSVANGQSATCWIAGGKGYAFVSNTGSSTLSSYSIRYTNGQLALLNAVAGTGDLPIDLATTADNGFLYVLNAGSGTVGMFRVNVNGSLTNLGEEGGNLPVYAQGMAVR